PRHVLTASHVVDWSTDQPERIEIHFAGNTPRATGFTSVAWAFTQIQGDSAPSDQLDEDYAVIVMNENERFGDQFGWLGTKEYDSSWDGETYWSSMGYDANGTFPMFQTDRWLDEDALDFGSGRAMTTSADLVGGQSGSPMFGFWDGDDAA